MNAAQAECLTRRLPRITTAALLARVLTVVALLLAAHGTGHTAEIAGVPRIITGDTVIIGKTHVRLASIAAPSLQQHCVDASGVLWTCGISARDELTRHVGKQPWTCQTGHNERDKCTVGNEDIGKWLVHSGWALAGRVHHDYEAEEAAAKAAKAGLWAGAFIAPQEWRRRNAQAPVLGSHQVAEASRAILYPGRHTLTSPSPECAIKGHYNRSGTCIYHMPGGRWYARVTMELDNGDRWFCSREEADAAGCRETKR